MAQQQQGNNRRPTQNAQEKTKAVTVKDFSGLAKKFEDQFDRLLPTQIKRSSVMNAPRVTGLLINLWMTNEDIRECPPSTIFNSVAMACQVGLEFNSALGQSYIIPYTNKKQGGRKEAQWQAGYRGLLTLAQRSEKVEGPYAQFVMPDDEFDFEYGTNQFLRHKPAPRQAPSRNKSLNEDILDNFLYAYFYVKMRTGGYTFHVMDREDVLSIRDQSAQGVFDDKGNPKWASPWNRFTSEMIRKTPTKQHLKYLDLTPHLSMAAGLDDQAEAGVAQDRVIDWKEYSSADDLDHADEIGHQWTGTGPGEGKGQGQQGAESGEAANGGQQGQELAPAPGPSDPESVSDDTKGPFEAWMFGKDLNRLKEAAKANGHAMNEAQFLGLIGRFDRTKGEFIRMVLSAKDNK